MKSAAEFELIADKDGRFQFDAVMPGRTVTIGAYSSQGWIKSDKLENLTIKPGEAKDLGDVVVKPQK
jgi:hypothetical protein